MDRWQLKDTLKVAMQTIDSCNNKCYMCPYSITYHTGKEISDEVFLKFISSLKEYMDYHKLDIVKFDMFLQNEPLLDKNLFKRIKFIKQVIPGSKFEISSNGLLIHKYEHDLIKYVDYHFYNIGGWDAQSYNISHRVNIDQDYFDRMMKTAERIKSQFDKGMVIITRFNKDKVEDVEKPEEWYIRDYSRGGILSNETLYHDKIYGCYWKKHKFWNMLVDGTLILCFQDWRRQTVLGNINHQSLIEIEKSELRKAYIDKVEGRISEKDFICKKCELALGDNKFVNQDKLWVPRSFKR